MRGSTIWWLSLGGLCLLLGGCQRLHYEKSVTLLPGDNQRIEISAPSGEQKVEVQVTASNPVNAYVVLEPELKAVEKSGKFDKSKALTSKEKVSSETLTATVPANKIFGVIVSDASKKSEVKIVIDGR